MKLNKEKRIGRILFVVEGSQTEFSILKRIFSNILGYTYIEKRRNKLTYFTNGKDRYSQVAIINTKESNIKDISENEDYLDEVFETLRERYHFPVDQSAIYYLFDRDPKSNTNTELIEKYILSLANPYDNEDFKAGQLLLSYPSVESYIVSNFKDDTSDMCFSLGREIKTYIGKNTDIQINKISEETIIKAADEFLRYLSDEQIAFDIDNFSNASHNIFNKQEIEYLSGRGFKLFSMLTLAFLQMGIIDMEL